MAGRIGYSLGKLRLSSRELEQKAWDSDCVRELEYDVERQQMTVHFMKRGSYTYFDVDPWTFGEFNNAGSRGTYFNLYIRGRFSYERVA